MERRQVLAGGIAAAMMVTGSMIGAEASVVVLPKESLPEERRRLVNALVVQFTEKPGTEQVAEAALGICKGCRAAARSVAPWFEAKMWEHYRDHPQYGRLVQALYADPSGFDTHAKVMGVFRSLPNDEMAVLLFIWDTSKGFIFPMKGAPQDITLARDMGDTFFLAARVGGDPRTGPVTMNPVREITIHDDASVLDG